MGNKLTVNELKKQLASRPPIQLLEEIVLLYQKFPIVKEYYQAKFSNDDGSLLEKYKTMVWEEFVGRGNRLPKMRLSVARKVVTDFKKITNSQFDVADLMITYVEAGVRCTNEYGDIDEPFYNSMESMYEAALKHVAKEQLFADFADRLRFIVLNTSGIGWGFHDQLSDLFEQYGSKTK